MTIGTEKGASPRFGDWVYLAPGAKVFGPVRMGDRSAAGANAVDTPMSTTVSGARPAPWRSANAPSTAAEGRTRKATPYTASDESSDAVSLSEGRDLADRHGEEAVDREIEPLHEVPDRRGARDAAATAGVTFDCSSSVLMRSASRSSLGDGLPGKRLPHQRRGANPACAA